MHGKPTELITYRLYVIFIIWIPRVIPKVIPKKFSIPWTIVQLYLNLLKIIFVTFYGPNRIVFNISWGFYICHGPGAFHVSGRG